ncbi:MAG: sensor histidine kinase [Thiohalomonadaceae bacterium]
MTSSSRNDNFFLPDFCGLPAVFAVVVLSEIFAFILTLAQLGRGAEMWDTLALTSLFMQWAGLTGAAVLCSGRRWLVRLGDRGAALVSYGLLLLVILILSELAWWFILDSGLHDSSGGHFRFVLRNLAIGAIVGALILRYFYLTHQSRQRLLAESEARFAALQARIRPHFLFNSMNSIASLTRSDPAQAEAAIEDLADLFRASLGDGRRLIPLAEELALTRRYLHMESLRLGTRLRLDWQIDALPQDAAIPPLTLQPLVENAIYHGIEQLADGGSITVHGSAEGGGLILCVTNPCPAHARERSGNRVAVDNIRQRLAFHFGADAVLEAEERAGSYQVRLRWPYRRQA